jgi:hypothetical protein
MKLACMQTDLIIPEVALWNFYCFICSSEYNYLMHVNLPFKGRRLCNQMNGTSPVNYISIWEIIIKKKQHIKALRISTIYELFLHIKKAYSVNYLGNETFF